MTLNRLLKLLCAMLAAMCVQHAHAFCTIADEGQGWSPVNFLVLGAPLRVFEATLYAGQKQCCSWQEKSCNPSGKRDALLKAAVFRFTTLRTQNKCVTTCMPCPGLCVCKEQIVCNDIDVRWGQVCEVEFPAGGTLHFGMVNGTWGVRSYAPNGSKHFEGSCAEGEDPIKNLKFLHTGR